MGASVQQNLHASIKVERGVIKFRE